MSDAIRPWQVNRTPTPELAEQQLGQTVKRLEGARWRQLTLDWVWRCLLYALGLAALLIVANRVFGWSLPEGLNAFGLSVGFALLGALVGAIIAWRARPDSLRVAIDADMMLKLKQRLSTAWEFALDRTSPPADPARADPMLTSLANNRQTLALQAVRARLPMRPEHVFPLQLNTHARLLPIALALLVFVSVFEFSRFTDTSPLEGDPLVMREGEQLHRYAKAMEGRARVRELPRTAARASDIKSLANQMQTGELSRSEALMGLSRLSSTLDEARRAARAEAGNLAQPLPSDGRPMEAPADALRKQLESLLDRALTPDDFRLSASEREAMRALGIGEDDWDDALEQLGEGDDQELRDLIEKLRANHRAREDADELQRAYDRVRRIRENLGDQSAVAEEPQSSGQNAPADDDEDFPSSVPGIGLSSAMTDEVRFGQPTGAGNAPDVNTGDEIEAVEKPNDAQAIRPRGQLGEGKQVIVRTRVRPQGGELTITPKDLEATIAAQLESVINKQELPAHQKEFVRRYFLSINQGAAPNQSSTSQ
ncbi:MAG: hypothetical protein AAF493_01975 [Pseudomonadota bacterium]